LPREQSIGGRAISPSLFLVSFAVYVVVAVLGGGESVGGWHDEESSLAALDSVLS
jgi:hypothetical protein